MYDFMFVIFATFALVGGLLMVFHPSIVHSAFALVASLFGVAGLYWTLGADFLGVTQVVLYVSGVTVLLLFAVMLSDKTLGAVSILRCAAMGLVIGPLAMALMVTYRAIDGMVGTEGAALPDPAPTTPAIGDLLLQPEGYLVPFEVASVLLLIVLVGAVTLARPMADRQVSRKTIADRADAEARGDEGASAPQGEGA